MYNIQSESLRDVFLWLYLDLFISCLINYVLHLETSQLYVPTEGSQGVQHPLRKMKGDDIMTFCCKFLIVNIPSDQLEKASVWLWWIIAWCNAYCKPCCLCVVYCNPVTKHSEQWNTSFKLYPSKKSQQSLPILICS